MSAREVGLVAWQEWADPGRRHQILFAARFVETQPSLIGFSDYLIAAATKPWDSLPRGMSESEARTPARLEVGPFGRCTARCPYSRDHDSGVWLSPGQNEAKSMLAVGCVHADRVLALLQAASDEARLGHTAIYFPTSLLASNSS
jgi:hypothetical protein